MPFSPIPRGVYPSVTSLDPKKLKEKGITLVLADLDNTLAPYKVLEPDPEVAAWKEALEREGIQLFILSNSRKPTRASHFAQALDIPYQGHSGKPKRGGYLRAMERMGCTPEQTVMVGDQIFTDDPGGRNAGCSPCWWSPSAWRATRAATCATPQSGPSAFWENGGQNPYERNLRPGGQRRFLPL